MQKITSQPTGIYRQFMPSQINKQNNAAVVNNNVNTNNECPPKFNKKKILKLGTLAAIGLSAIGLICYYKKGVSFITEGNKVLEEAEKQFGKKKDAVKEYLAKAAISPDDKAYKETVYKKGKEFAGSIVGKIHRGLKSITAFMQKHFYSYDN